MKEVNKLFYKTIVLIFFVLSTQVESKTLSIGSPDAKVTIKVFSSLTCPHCASFHTKVYEKLKKEYIDKGLVKFEHHAFPLDLAALNAEVIVRCQDNNEKKFELLTEIYNKNFLIHSHGEIITSNIAYSLALTSSIGSIIPHQYYFSSEEGSITACGNKFHQNNFIINNCKDFKLNSFSNYKTNKDINDLLKDINKYPLFPKY